MADVWGQISRANKAESGNTTTASALFNVEYQFSNVLRKTGVSFVKIDVAESYRQGRIDRFVCKVTNLTADEDIAVFVNGVYAHSTFRIDITSYKTATKTTYGRVITLLPQYTTLLQDQFLFEVRKVQRDEKID